MKMLCTLVGIALLVVAGIYFVTPADTLVATPHRLAEMPDHDLWMTFVRDPDGHLIGLMMEAPRGYAPPA